MNKETKIIVSVLITGLLTFFGIWYISTCALGTNPIQSKIAEIANGNFFPNLLSICLEFGMIGVAICCTNTFLILPELITKGTNATLNLIFYILRAILAIVFCLLISIGFVSSCETVMGKILYVLLCIILTLVVFAPTIAFLFNLSNTKDLTEAIIIFLFASLGVILLLMLFIPAIIGLVIFIALKIILFFASSSSGYDYSSESPSDSNDDKEVEENPYIYRNGMATELIPLDAYTWRDSSGRHYKSNDGGRTFYED